MSNPLNFDNADVRWKIILKAIVDYASGNFNAPTFEPEQGDEIDALAQGIIMLGEELKATTISRDYLRNIYEGIADMLIITKESLEIIDANQIASDLSGYTDEQLKRLTLSHLFPQIIYEEDLNNKIQKLKELKLLKNIELELKGKNGQIPVSASITHLHDSMNKQSYLLMVAKDISKLMSIQKRLEQRNQEMSFLTYRLSHDFRAPLTNVIGLIDILQTMVLDPDFKPGEAHELLQKSLRSAQQLDKILFYFKEIAYIGEELKNTEPVHFDELLEEIQAEVKTNFAGRSYKLSVHNRIRENRFTTSRHLVKMLLSNLINNAIEHNRNEDLQVEVDLNDLKDRIQFQVKDNGQGISPKIINDVFKMFIKSSSKGMNAGLGLYFAKTMVDQLFGEINISADQNGTVVHVTLPLKLS